MARNAGQSVQHRRATRATRKERAGFTMIELMVSLAVGGVAIGAIYAIGSASTRQFQAEHYIANTQSSLRIAMSQVKRDIARAGFL
jgi:prepilin-type N-terminal cleavage/methylation domain-containing protein